MTQNDYAAIGAVVVEVWIAAAIVVAILAIIRIVVAHYQIKDLHGWVERQSERVGALESGAGFIGRVGGVERLVEGQGARIDALEGHLEARLDSLSRTMMQYREDTKGMEKRLDAIPAQTAGNVNEAAAPIVDLVREVQGNVSAHTHAINALRASHEIHVEAVNTAFSSTNKWIDRLNDRLVKAEMEIEHVTGRVPRPSTTPDQDEDGPRIPRR